MKGCVNCGSFQLITGRDLCIWCEKTEEIVISGDVDAAIDLAVQKEDRPYCTNCGTKKKWVTIEVRKGPEFVCPRC